MNNMKNQLKYTAFLMLVLLVPSCRDEEKYPIPDITRGAIPVFVQDDNDTGFINFLDFDASRLAFDVDRLGSEEVASVDVWLTFNNSQTGESETISYKTVSAFPEKVTFSFDELLALFPPQVVTEDTLSLGDSFVVGGFAMLADGRYLDGGYSPSVVANHPVYVTYNVACASDLGGVYDFTRISGTSTATTLLNQTIVERAPGYYEVPDITMEYFAGTPVKYRFTDICGTLYPDDESVDYGAQVVVQLNAGTNVDMVTGEITFDVEYIAPSCCGLLGKKVMFKATPK